MEPTVWNNQGGAYDYEKSELQSILDAITEPLILINSDFSIKRVNRASLEFTGENAFRSVLNRKCYEALYDRDDVCPYCPLKKHSPSLQNFNDIFDSDSQSYKDMEREIFARADGKSATLYLSFFPLEKDGNIYSIIEKISNITGIKEKEEETLRMRNLASLGILVSGVAHELNNPLTGISLTLQNLQNNLSTYDLQFFEKRLDMIKKDLARASIIVADILSFAKSEKINTTLGDLREAVYRARDTAERLYPVLCKKITWEIECEENTIFYFNPVKIERLLLNLFRNSLQAFDYNSGTIRVEVRKTKNWHYIIVEDNAGGISPNIIDKIFDPFFTNKKSTAGTGLGLSICHSIVREHKGKINVKSFDRKTRFSISLPGGQEEKKQ